MGNTKWITKWLGGKWGIPETDISDDSSSKDEDGIDDEDEHVGNDEGTIPFITHTLPFKGIGVTHNKDYQCHLENAFCKLKEDDQSVSAHNTWAW